MLQSSSETVTLTLKGHEAVEIGSPAKGANRLEKKLKAGIMDGRFVDRMANNTALKDVKAVFLGFAFTVISPPTVEPTVKPTLRSFRFSAGAIAGLALLAVVVCGFCVGCAVYLTLYFNPYRVRLFFLLLITPFSNAIPFSF